MNDCYFSSALGMRVCDDPIVISEPSTNSAPWLLWILFAALLIALIFVIARYCYEVATRTGRSRIGFVWLSIFFPLAALLTCLILDKDENRYSKEEKEKYKIKGRFLEDS